MKIMIEKGFPAVGDSLNNFSRYGFMCAAAVQTEYKFYVCLLK